MFTSSHIETIAVFVRMGDNPPSLQLALEGIVQVGEPVAVRRADALAMYGLYDQSPEFEGPAIIDLRVDETTDIDGCIATIHPSTTMLETIKKGAWNKLVDNGPLSLNGETFIRWEHDANVPVTPVSHVPKVGHFLSGRNSNRFQSSNKLWLMQRLKSLNQGCKKFRQNHQSIRFKRRCKRIFHPNFH